MDGRSFLWRGGLCWSELSARAQFLDFLKRGLLGSLSGRFGDLSYMTVNLSNKILDLSSRFWSLSRIWGGYL